MVSLNSPVVSVASANEHSEESPFQMLDLERQRVEDYAREQFEKICAERSALAEERKNAEADMERRREELEQRSQKRAEAESAADETAESELDRLHRQCLEYQFQIELLQGERDAAWIQSRKGRGRADGLQAELDALRLDAGTQAADLQRRLDDLLRERDEARAVVEKWRLNTDEHVDLSGPPSTRTNLSVETFGLEHTDLKLGGKDDMQRTREECNSLRAELAQLRSDWDSHDVEFTRLRQQVQSEQASLSAEVQSLFLREKAFEEYVARVRQELTDERARLGKEVISFHEEMATEARDREEREADLRDWQCTLRLQESELRELAEINENDCARERAKLTEERLRIARLREALRLERETPPKRGNK